MGLWLEFSPRRRGQGSLPKYHRARIVPHCFLFVLHVFFVFFVFTPSRHSLQVSICLIFARQSKRNSRHICNGLDDELVFILRC